MGIGTDISFATRRAAGRAAAWPLLLCILAAAAVPARAAGIIYNNFGDDDASVADGAWAISQGYPIHAQPFTVAGTSYRLDRVVLALSEDNNPAQKIDVAVMTDRGGLPDAVLETFHFDGTMPPFDGKHHAPLVGESSLRLVLEGGTTYWLAASVKPYTSIPAVYASWNWNSTGDKGVLVGYIAAQDRWFVAQENATLGAFRVEGTPVPEPAAALLGAAAALALRSRRQRTGS
jgi:hypothetical protein